ncbi:MAG: alpha/beta hydrolase [Clostridia bacterium]
MLIFIIALLVLVLVIYLIGNYFYTHSIQKESIMKKRNDPEIDAGEEEYLEWFKQNTSCLTMYSEDAEHLKLNAYTKLCSGSKKWAVILHGYAGNAKRMSMYAKKFFDQGYNILLPDLRGHGLSEGSYIGMGIRDSKDIIDWCNLLNKNHADARIVLVGISMGAATVMSASGRENLPKNVKAIIEDCGYTSTYDQFAYQLKRDYNLPPFPVMQIANLYVKIKHGFSYKDYAPIDMLAKSNLPIFLIHGDADRYVPFEMLDELSKVVNAEKKVIAVHDAKHTEARKILGEKYFEEVFNFLSKFMY